MQSILEKNSLTHQEWDQQLKNLRTPPIGAQKLRVECHKTSVRMKMRGNREAAVQGEKLCTSAINVLKLAIVRIASLVGTGQLLATLGEEAKHLGQHGEISAREVMETLKGKNKMVVGCSKTKPRGRDTSCTPRSDATKENPRGRVQLSKKECHAVGLLSPRWLWVRLWLQQRSEPASQTQNLGLINHGSSRTTTLLLLLLQHHLLQSPPSILLLLLRNSENLSL